MDEAAAYRELIRLGQENHNMFHTAILLHNQTLLAENINMESGLQIGQQLGSLNLGNSINSPHCTRIIKSVKMFRKNINSKQCQLARISDCCLGSTEQAE